MKSLKISLLIGFLFVAAAPAPGQQATPSSAGSAVAELAGRAIDAEHGLPLEGVRVSVHRMSDGVRLEASPAQVQTTNTDGHYRFSGLQPGWYLLRAELLGYGPRDVQVRLRAEARDLSIGMRIAPIVLSPVRVQSTPEPFADQGADRAGSAEVAAERLRQRLYLGSDTRVLSFGEVRSAVVFGETDLFRAMQQIPGVATRDDYSAELWVRGARWDQTLVHLDGIPLFNPLHAAGIFSVVNADALGRVVFHPGAQPTAEGSGAAGFVELTTRRGGPAGLRSRGELSLISTRLALDGSLADRGGWMIAGRRSHVDLLTLGLSKLTGDERLHVPYGFSDVAGRADYSLSERVTLEVSGLTGANRLRDEIDGLVTGSTASWGQRMLRVALEQALGRGTARYTMGWSRFGADAWERDTMSAAGGPADPASQGSFLVQPFDNAIAAVIADARWAAAVDSSGVSPTAAGLRLNRYRAHYSTQGTWPFRPSRGSTRGEHELTYAAAWGHRRWSVARDLVLETGLRAELGGEIRETPRLRIAPQVSARLRLTPDLALSSAVSRSFQYTQAITPTGPGLYSVGLANLFWTVAGDTLPAMRSDLFTLGIEGWLGPDALATATVYRRLVSGVAVPDPVPGWVGGIPTPQTPVRLTAPRLFEVGQNVATGLELSVRKMGAGWTGSAGYSFSRSEHFAAGYRFDAPTDRRHVGAVSALLAPAPGLRAGAAFSMASGAPYTRQFLAVQCMQVDPCVPMEVAYSGPPSGERAGPYRSLDLLAEYSRRVGGAELSLYAQLRNLLNRDNPAAYRQSGYSCLSPTGASTCFIFTGDPLPLQHEGFVDGFLPGLSRVPVVGLRFVL